MYFLCNVLYISFHFVTSLQADGGGEVDWLLDGVWTPDIAGDRVDVLLNRSGYFEQLDLGVCRVQRLC